MHRGGTALRASSGTVDSSKCIFYRRICAGRCSHSIPGLHFKTVSIELLVSIAAIGACCIGEFSEAAIVTFLFQFGSFLEQKTMKKTRSAIKSLTEMAPSTAWRIAGDTIGKSYRIDPQKSVDAVLIYGKIEITIQYTEYGGKNNGSTFN